MTKKQILRLLISPLIYMTNLVTCIALLLFPGTLLMGMSLIALLEFPFVKLINLGEDSDNKSKGLLGNDDPFIEGFSPVVCHLLGLTYIIWTPFYASFIWVKEGNHLLSD